MAFELVIFDLGGVVVESKSDRLILQVSQLLGRPFEEVHEAVYDEELLLPFELGQMRPQAYYGGLKQRLKLPWSFEQFVKAWNGILTEKPEMGTLMARLHKRHKLTALSNTNELHINHVRDFPSLSHFDDWVASCEVGLRKPDPQIYLLAIRRAGVRPEAVVYVDDRPEFVKAGEGAGLTAIRFESGQQIEQALRAVGLNV